LTNYRQHLSRIFGERKVSQLRKIHSLKKPRFGTILRTIVLMNLCVSGSFSCYQPPAMLDRSPSGPCWDIHLSDGFSSEKELTDTFYCLNNTNNFDAFQNTVQTFSQADRNGNPIGKNLASIFNQLLFQQDMSPITMVLERYLRDHTNQTQSLSKIGIVMLYGTHVDSPFDDALLEQGMIHPIVSTFPSFSEYLLNHNSDREKLGAVLQREELAKMLCTSFGIIQDPQHQERVFNLPEMLGEVIEATQNPENDRWNDASGNSLYDFVATLLSAEDSEAPLLQFQSDLKIIAEDTRIRTPLQNVLLEQLGPELIPALIHLMEVNRNGSIRSSTENSALYDLFAVLDTSNQSLECSFDILDVPISEISIDNLAVELLTRIANLNPDALESGVELLPLVDLGISQLMLERIVDRGACPLLTEEYVEQIQVLGRLADPEVKPLLNLGIDVLNILQHPVDSRIPEITNTLARIHSTQLTHPTEELITDILETEFVDAALDIIPTLPQQTAECPSDWEPITWYELWNAGGEILERENLQTLNRFGSFAFEQEALWTVYQNQSFILQSDEFKKLLPILHTLDLYTIDLPDSSLDMEPMLYVLENTDFSSEISAYSEEELTPLTWTGKLLLDDTLQTTITLLQWLNERLSILGED